MIIINLNWEIMLFSSQISSIFDLNWYLIKFEANFNEPFWSADFVMFMFCVMSETFTLAHGADGVGGVGLHLVRLVPEAQVQAGN